MTIGLMATATFLIVAMSSFRLTPTESGSGGFDLVAESSVPIYEDLNTESARRDLLADDAAVLSEGNLFALRTRPGDDASCRNLYKPTRPRVLGITPDFIRHFDSNDVPHFDWSSADAKNQQQADNPWHVLSSTDEEESNVVPVVLDQNTAMYSLGLYGGIGQKIEFEYEDGHRIQFEVVGLLSNSVFQGSLLISEGQFRKHFPLTSGYRYFLIQSPQGRSAEVATILEDRLGDQGFDVTSTREILEGLLAVQNTYLSAFQSLGALGLLLGAFGLAAVQLRNVFERRKEIALMRAAGFSRRRLAQMVFLENVVLLLGGLATGVFAALVAVLPHILIGGAKIPPGELTVMLVVIFVAGLFAGLVGVRATSRAPLVAALRGD